MPRNMVMLMPPITARVVAAFFDCGRRKAWTPSAMASTPVRAVAPEAKARSRRKNPRAPIGSSWMPAVAAVGHPVTHLANPSPSVRKTIATNP
jgi:hypothetical protein